VVVLTLLQNSGELRSHAGHISVGILLAQDFAVVPMIIVLGLLGGDEPDSAVITMQLIGGAALMTVVIWAFRGKRGRLPLPAIVRQDGELQIFVALILAFGLAWLSGVLHLSAALGAFVAGLAVAAARETYWLRRRLEPFHIMMVALFFVSVGMLIDLNFLLEYWWQVLLLVVVVLLSNTFITALVLRVLGESWAHALFVGAMLGQIGEFSFVLAALGKSGGLISEFGYQMTLAVIVLSLVASAPWIALWRKLLNVSDAQVATAALAARQAAQPDPAETTAQPDEQPAR
jgi:CPA2 family monovalent cation:H+ antiporter-2